MKRFTETTKWNDPWFRRLSEKAKLLWSYLCDNCNAIGLIDLDLEDATFRVGGKITDEHVKELGDRIEFVRGGKVFIPKFIYFQYGELSPNCPAHKPILKLVEQHQLLRDSIAYRYPNATLALPIAMGTGKGKGTGKGTGEGEGDVPNDGYHKDARAVLYILNETCGKHFRETDANLRAITYRLKEPGVDLEGVKQMIKRQCQRWKGSRMEEYLRPETLFGKTKFDSYYASKDLPIHENDEATRSRGDERNFGTGVDTSANGERTAALIAAKNGGQTSMPL